MPRAGDSVSIGSATARNGNQASCDTDVVVVDVVTPTLVAVTVQCVSATCQGTLRVSGAAALNAASVTINGALQLLLGSTVKATSAFNLNALGLLQGSGTIDSPASVLRGSVSPGIIMGCATSACASPFSARLPSAGTLNFPGAITTFIGANVFLKYLVCASFCSCAWRRFSLRARAGFHCHDYGLYECALDSHTGQHRVQRVALLHDGVQAVV